MSCTDALRKKKTVNNVIMRAYPKQPVIEKSVFITVDKTKARRHSLVVDKLLKYFPCI